MVKTEFPGDLELQATRPTIRWGVVGAGHIAHRFAQSLGFVSDAELAGVWARRDVQAQAFARQHGTHAYLSFDDLLNNIDALYVATLSGQSFALRNARVVSTVRRSVREARRR